MEEKCTARYTWSDRFKGEQSLELLNDRYLRIREQMPRRRRRFGIDVACLSPGFKASNRMPRQWLAAAAVMVLFALAFAYYAMGATNLTEMLSRMPGVLVPLLLAASFLIVFWRGRLRGYTLQTRHAELPLVTIQAPRADDVRALADFLDKLRPCIHNAEQALGLTPDVLRSGEVRTLRRLANEKVIGEADYDEAKLLIFRAS